MKRLERDRRPVEVVVGVRNIVSIRQSTKGVAPKFNMVEYCRNLVGVYTNAAEGAPSLWQSVGNGMDECGGDPTHNGVRVDDDVDPSAVKYHCCSLFGTAIDLHHKFNGPAVIEELQEQRLALPQCARRVRVYLKSFPQQ
jgi:hypothetical protein